MQKKNVEIAVGKTIFRNVNNVDYTRNLHDECFLFDKIEGEDVRKHILVRKVFVFLGIQFGTRFIKKNYGTSVSLITRE